MRTPSLPPRRELTTKSGEILMTANHICLLHGLCDRPDGEAESTADLARAALPYIAFFRRFPRVWLLREAARTLHDRWVARQRIGRRITWRLTDRGRAILDRRVPSRIRGLGSYEGLAPLRAQSKYERQGSAVDARWGAAKNGELPEQLVTEADRIVFKWSRRHAPHCFNDALKHEYFKDELRRFVRSFVLRYHAPPLGALDVFQGRSKSPFVVDFDDLRAT